MILDYYKLKQQPFGVTPDPRCLYLSPTHSEALASLFYGIASGQGFMSLVAKPGMGKTTILLQVLQQLDGSVKTVFLFQMLCTPQDFLRTLLHDLGAPHDGGDVAQMQLQLNEILLQQSRRGGRLLVVIDEAQNLPGPVLEFVRTFSNFETPYKKLVQIVLAGQPQFAEKLTSPDLIQLRQRISVMARLKPFSTKEVGLYIDHRLGLAGYDFQAPIFTERARALIAGHSEGIPRNINNICFNALSAGCALKRKTIDWDVIAEVLDDLDPHQVSEEPFRSSRAIEIGASQSLAASSRKWLLQESLPRVALIAVLLVALTWSVAAGRGTGKTPASRIPMAADQNFVGSTLRSFPSSVGAGQAHNTGAGRSVDITSPDHPTVPPDSLAPLSGAKTPPGAEATNLTADEDRALLLEQIGQKNTDAEVALAKLYMEGKVVAQNCGQAQVLLLSAARNGNKLGEAFLAHDYPEHCQ